MSSKKEKLLIIDANALIHRAFYALPPLSDSQKRPTNAVYGFTMIFLKAIKDLKPDYIAACFDRKEKTFRHEEYLEYKAKRIKAPDELYEQIPLVKEVIKSFDIPIFELAGYEADDLIGTIATLKSVDRPDIETIILTGDQDCLQLVDYNTKVLSPHKGLSETILYDEQEVKKKFGGLNPKQLIDYKGLRGDLSDNIPGVKGIGEKSAIDLLLNFNSLEGVYKNINSEKIRDRIREALIKQKEQALMSKKLATIILDAPINFKLSDCHFKGFNQDKIAELFMKLGFKRLMNQIVTLTKSGFIVPIGQGNLFTAKKDFKSETKESTKLINKKIGEQNYQTITENNLKSFLKELSQQKFICFDTETDGLNPFDNKLIGISFCWKPGEAYYLPLELAEKIKTNLKQIFTNETIKKIGHNLKFDIEVLINWFTNKNKPIKIGGIYFDTMIASYLLNPGHRQHNLDTLAFVEFGYQMQSIEELIGTGKKQITMAEVPLEKISWYACEDADLTYRLYEKFSLELKKENLYGLFNELEMPLIEVLSEMEKRGVKIDNQSLKKLSLDFAKRIEVIEKKAWELAGEKFNLASPKQLKEILFDKLKISTAGIGKTKTGISTAAGELEKLQGQHKIIDLIIEFRELSKLKSTYLDALPKLESKIDGRIHTSFNQTITATGRLSSSEPNLQNIPIRSELGGLIRRAFIAESGFKIIKADYSQIELRIIASLANDKKMLDIFNSGGDIHTMTAAIIYGIKPEEVTKEIRRTAKEINFGVLYGMGAWGLASRTGLSNNEAQQFIFKYFDTFKEVKKWLDETIEIARDKGYVETLYGRRRFLPEINSNISQVRNSAERMAVNMPIQGTAADLIKLAMIKIHKELPKISPKSKMILQVHDELVFEVPNKEIKKVAKFINQAMCSVMKLRAPIEVEISFGDNWGETKEIKIKNR